MINRPMLMWFQVPERASDIVEQHRSQADPKLLNRLQKVCATLVLDMPAYTSTYTFPAFRRTSHLVARRVVQSARTSRSPRDYQVRPHYRVPLTQLISGSSKFLLPLVSYVFNDGPWRDTQIRLKYDPRTDPEARLCVEAVTKPVP